MIKGTQKQRQQQTQTGLIEVRIHQLACGHRCRGHTGVHPSCLPVRAQTQGLKRLRTRVGRPQVAPRPPRDRPHRCPSARSRRAQRPDADQQVGKCTGDLTGYGGRARGFHCNSPGKRRPEVTGSRGPIAEEAAVLQPKGSGNDQIEVN